MDALKEEIKGLNEKLKKKTERVSKLIRNNARLKFELERISDEKEHFRKLYAALKPCVPYKYYKTSYIVIYGQKRTEHTGLLKASHPDELLFILKDRHGAERIEITDILQVAS